MLYSNANALLNFYVPGVKNYKLFITCYVSLVWMTFINIFPLLFFLSLFFPFPSSLLLQQCSDCEHLSSQSDRIRTNALGSTYSVQLCCDATPLPSSVYSTLPSSLSYCVVLRERTFYTSHYLNLLSSLCWYNHCPFLSPPVLSSFLLSSLPILPSTVLSSLLLFFPLSSLLSSSSVIAGSGYEGLIHPPDLKRSVVGQGRESVGGEIHLYDTG